MNPAISDESDIWDSSENETPLQVPLSKEHLQPSQVILSKEQLQDKRTDQAKNAEVAIRVLNCGVVFEGTKSLEKEEGHFVGRNDGGDAAGLNDGGDAAGLNDGGDAAGLNDGDDAAGRNDGGDPVGGKKENHAGNAPAQRVGELDTLRISENKSQSCPLNVRHSQNLGAALQAKEAEKLHIESTDFVFGQTPMAVCRSHFVALAHHNKLSEQALAHKILTANEEQRLQLLESFYSSRYTELLRTQRKVLCKPRGKITTTRMRIIAREAEKSCHPFSSDSDSESSACKDPVQRAGKSEKSIRPKSSSQFDPGRKKTTNKPQRVSWKTRKHRRLLDTDEGSTTSDDVEPDGKRVEMMEKVAETQKVCDNETRSSLPLRFDIVRAHGTEETARSNAVSVSTDPSVIKMTDAANPKPEPSNPSKDLHAEQPSDCQPVQGGRDELAELLGDTSILNSLFTASQKRRPSSGNRIRNNDYPQRITPGDKEDETGNSHVRTTNADTESICDINLGACSVMENREGFDTGNNLENGAEVTPGVNCEHRDDSSRGGFAPRRQNGMDDFIAQLLNNPNLSCPKDSQSQKKTAQVHRPKVSSSDDGWDPRMWRKNESFFLCRREEK